MVKLQNKDILTLQDGRTATDLCMMICSYMSSNGFYRILHLICFISNDLIERQGIFTLLDIIKDFMEQGLGLSSHSFHISSVFRTIVSFIAVITFPNTVHNYQWPCRHGFLGSQEPIDFEKWLSEPIIFCTKYHESNHCEPIN